MALDANDIRWREDYHENTIYENSFGTLRVCQLAQNQLNQLKLSNWQSIENVEEVRIEKSRIDVENNAETIDGSVTNQPPSTIALTGRKFIRVVTTNPEPSTTDPG